MRATIRILAALLCLALVPRFATAAGTLTAVEGMSSTIFQQGQSSFSGIGLRARLHPARVIEAIEFMPSIEYWRNSNTVQPYDIKTMRKDATFGVDARYHFTTGGWNPYIGAGYSLHFLSSRVNAPSLGLAEATNSVTKGGLDALAGATFGLTGRIDNFLEVKYHHVPDYRQLKINWGLSVRL
jgi:hypothetical protein